MAEHRNATEAIPITRPVDITIAMVAEKFQISTYFGHKEQKRVVNLIPLVDSIHLVGPKQLRTLTLSEAKDTCKHEPKRKQKKTTIHCANFAAVYVNVKEINTRVGVDG